MKKYLIIIPLILFVLNKPTLLLAQSNETEQDMKTRSSRRGFYLSGVGFVGSEILETKRFAGGAGLRIGGGITENLLLYLEAQGSVVDQSRFKNLIFFDAQLKGQYYIWKGLYMNAGAGVTIARLQTVTILISEAKTGISASGGLGYEFRVGKKFFVAPEFGFYYRRVGKTNYFSPVIGGQLGWHF